MDYIVYKEDSVQNIIRKIEGISGELTTEGTALKKLGRDMISLSYLRSFGSSIQKAEKKLYDINDGWAALRQAMQRVDELMQSTETELVRRIQSGDVGGNHQIQKGQDTQTVSIRNWVDHIKNIFKDIVEKNKKSYEAYLKEANEARVYDDKGTYGGNQSNAKDHISQYDQYIQMIEKNTGRKLSHEDLEKYLGGMANEGCGYMAIVNQIMKHYEGRADDFQRDFGFPMYDAQRGDLNYDMLMVDLYSSTDNHNKFLFWDTRNNREDYNFGDGLFRYDYYTDTERRGTSQADQIYRMNLYLEEHGMELNADTYSRNQITVDNYDEFAKKGQVVINTGHPLYMRRADGSYKIWSDGSNHADGGHAMTITGVETINIDGVPTKVFRVSSWDQIYYINPADKNGMTSYYISTIKKK